MRGMVDSSKRATRNSPMLSPDTILQQRYRIVRQLGQGGMGAVYEAIDERLDTVVALKETLFADERLRKQFEREARLLARLHHPALPRVSDHFAEREGQFLIMQYIAGEDLAEMLREKNGPFPQDEVLVWADQLCDALDYLHTQDPQIIHRDIKPQNLKLTARGQIVLLDFGLAKGSAGQMSVVTTSASIFGYTPNYAPLEQVQGLGTDPRSDIYSLAATLYHLLTNVKPPDALSRAGAIVNGQTDPLSPANRVTAQVGASVAAALSKGMSQNRAERYSSATAMREALRDAARHPIHEATTVLTSGSAAFAGANAVASEDQTRLAGVRTRMDGSEARTLVAGDTTNVRRTMLGAETATVARPAFAGRSSRVWLAAAGLLILIAGGAGGFYAYRARRNAAQQTIPPASANPAQAADSNQPTSAPNNSVQTEPNKTSETKIDKAKVDSSSERSGATKSSARTTAEPGNATKIQPNERSAPAHENNRNPDSNRNPNVAPPTQLPPSDPLRNSQSRPQPHPPGTGDLPTTRTFPNGTRVVTQPDGTRIVIMPNGATRVFPPGERPNRRRNRIP